jgi:hypothetical protein
MILRNTRWEEIREQFTEEEKSELRKMPILGEVICPPGIAFDPDSIPQPLRDKFVAAIGNPERR